jgi:UDP-3-O-[3-hydroxymyristoyl] glucosamine N-acyltransferase
VKILQLQHHVQLPVQQKLVKTFKWVALSGVLGHLDICDNVSVGAHTLITKDINEPGDYVGIMPAQES